MIPNQELSLERIFKSADFTGASLGGIQWLPDSHAVTYNKKNKILRYDLNQKTETELLDPEKLVFNGTKIEMSEYFTTEEQHNLLIAGESKQLWRHSYTAPYFLYNTSTSELTPLVDGDPGLQNVQFSPDNKKVAFIKSSNLYIFNTSTLTTTQLTFDGNENILNGIFDWVYEEEFEKVDAFRWSRDSSKIAFWRLDQTKVKSYIIYDETSSNYASISNLKYPKVGEENSIVTIGIVDINTSKTEFINFNDEDEFYIPRIDWTTDPSILSIQKINRKQNDFQFLFYNIDTKSFTTIITEVSTTGWISIKDDFILFKKQEKFLFSSERSGYRHIYISDYQGNFKQITSGDWEVTSIIGFDEENELIYFDGKKDGPHNKMLYRVKLDGSDLKLLLEEKGWYSANFSPNYSKAVITYNNTQLPDQIFVIDNDGTKIASLLQNDLPALSSSNISWPVFSTINTSDNNTELSCYMVKPNNFDETRKYPVIFYGYSGPNHQVVTNQWIRIRNLWHSYMTSMGFIVFSVDGRGMSGRGRDFRHYAYGDISQWMIHDQIEGVKYLSTLPYIDTNNIGFWGWSGGGYMSCMLSTRASEYFKACVAVASCTDFSLYDTIWTERFMGLLGENQEGYKKANVLTYTENMNSNLLLIHGTGDDNVHCQHTLKFAEALVQANKQFDIMLYPNRTHGISGGNTSLHLYTKMTNFFVQHLNNKK